MGDFPDMTITPSISDFIAYIRLSLFDDLCRNLIKKCGAKPVFEYSRCSMERGWNLKFKKAGKNLCTIYPRAGFCTVMVVMAEKKKYRWRRRFLQCPKPFSASAIILLKGMVSGG